MEFLKQELPWLPEGSLRILQVSFRLLTPSLSSERFANQGQLRCTGLCTDLGFDKIARQAFEVHLAASSLSLHSLAIRIAAMRLCSTIESGSHSLFKLKRSPLAGLEKCACRWRLCC